MKQDEFIREYNEFYNKNYSEILDYKLFRFINHLLEKQKPMDEGIVYEGKGNHSVRTLETIVEQLIEKNSQLQIKLQSLHQPLSEEEIISKITDGLLSSKLFRLPTKDCFNLAEEIVHNHFKSLSLPPDSKENEADSLDKLQDELFVLANKFACINQGNVAVKLHSIHNGITLYKEGGEK